MDFAVKRAQMVRKQLRWRGITDRRVLEVMGELPREQFVPPEYQSDAYEDRPLPIGCDQTISQPYMVALMTQTLHLAGGEVVLEIGTGSGYQTAVLAGLAQYVYSVEKYPELAFLAQRTLRELNIANVEIMVGDGSLGWAERAPFDAIIVTAAAPLMPHPLIEQLRPEGRIVIPIGSQYDQELEFWERAGGTWRIRRLAPVRFVPLVGEAGWSR
ncbi:MAG: protein-L-isoaspartate(D-aspartate) O-methyltransferase [Chloroflexota bacterium]